MTCRAAARARSVARAGLPATRKILPSVPVPTSRLPSGFDQQVVRRVVAGLPERVPEAVGPDPIDRAAARPASDVAATAADGPPALTALSMTEMPVISVDTDGDRRPRRLGGRTVGGAIRAAAGGVALTRRGVDRAVGGDAQRVDLAEGRIEQHERLAGRVDAEHAAGRFGAGDQLARRARTRATRRWWRWSCRSARPCRRA